MDRMEDNPAAKEYLWEMIRRGSSGIKGSYWINHSSSISFDEGLADGRRGSSRRRGKVWIWPLVVATGELLERRREYAGQKHLPTRSFTVIPLAVVVNVRVVTSFGKTKALSKIVIGILSLA